jgi:hypothetical protein
VTSDHHENSQNKTSWDIEFWQKNEIQPDVHSTCCLWFEQKRQAFSFSPSPYRSPFFPREFTKTNNNKQPKQMFSFFLTN